MAGDKSNSELTQDQLEAQQARFAQIGAKNAKRDKADPNGRIVIHNADGSVKEIIDRRFR